jgi:hypothetical protein
MTRFGGRNFPPGLFSHQARHELLRKPARQGGLSTFQGVFSSFSSSKAA